MKRNVKNSKYILAIVMSVALCGTSAAAKPTDSTEAESGQQKKVSFVHCSVGTNFLDYVDFGTINGEISLSVARHFSINIGAKYNNWEFGEAENATWDKRRQFSAGMRYWPWYIYSGWWFGVKGQYEEYSRANFLNAIFYPECGKQYDKYGNLKGYGASEGDEFGVGISAGYTLMLHKNLNLDFGIGIWGGLDKRTVYDRPKEGKIDKEHSGNKFFILPNDIQVSLVYVF